MEERKGFGSNFGFLMAAIGSAVGLGNIWGFPNKMGANGGFTFLIIYLILAACCGFIVMMGELALGRKTGRGAIGAYKVLSKRFKWLGWLGVLSAFLILGFYCALGGYCLKYVTLNVGNLFHAGFGTGTLDGAGVFGALMANQGEAVIYGLIFVALTMIIVMGGVGGGIEKVCSVGMPALFVMLVICIIRSCTLEGASEGLKYMFVPGWALANGVIKEAPDFFSVLNISSPIKMSVGGILYGGYSYSYQSDFARKTFLCTRRVPQNQVSHSYQYLLATEEQPCFSMGYMNIILQKAQKSIVCCLGGAVPFGSAPLFLFQGGNNYVRVSIRIKADRGLSTLPDLPTIYRAADEG